MTVKLFVQAILKFALGVVLVGLLLFLPAGTWEYFGGWLLMGILFVPMFLAGIVMMWKNPDLLKSRLNAKEKQGEQQLVVKLSGLMFLGGFLLSSFDYRFGWSTVPFWLTVAAAVIFLVGYGLYAEVMRRGMVERLQREYKINIAGPSTMAALLNSLQMGFKTLAIQKSSGQVWKVLGEVKTEFANFEGILDNTQKKMLQASQELDKLIGVRTRAINRKLRDVSEYSGVETNIVEEIQENI